MFFRLLYHCVYAIGFLLFLPVMAYGFLRHGKYRSSFLKRFSIGFKTVLRKNGGPIIWAHAVSVGECRALLPLLEELHKDVANLTLVISSITETGHAEAKRTLGFADFHFYLPFDFYFVVKRVLSKCAPDLVLLSEGDFWYGFLEGAKKKGSVICVVNGKISESSQKRYSLLAPFSRRLFSMVDFFCVQSTVYKDRFISLGVAPSKIVVTGNVKGDVGTAYLSNAELAALKERLHIQSADIVVVIGSTHDSEEELLLGQLAPICKKHPHLKLILVPRHPERFAVVEQLCQQSGLSYTTWSDSKRQELRPQLYLIDAMGLLQQVYQVADIAIVAGSFTSKVGGHNILEPLTHGVATIVGPYMYTQTANFESALCMDAIVQVDGGDVAHTVEALMANPSRQKELGENALQLCKSLQGASRRTISAIKTLVPQIFC